MRGAVPPCLALVVLLLAGCRTAASESAVSVSSRLQRCSDRQRPTEGASTARIDALLASAGSDLYSVDEESLAALEAGLLEVDFHGLRLRAPERGDLSVHEELPLLYARRASGQRDWEVSPRLNAVLVAVDQGQGHVHHGWAFQPHKRPAPASLVRSKEGEPPGEQERTSINAELGLLEARRLVALPWRAGRYTFTLISWDRVSNTVAMELSESTPPPRGPRPLSPEQATALLEAWRKAGGSSSSKASAVAEGATLSLPRRARLGAGLRVRGTLRMQLQQGMVAESGAPKAGAAFLSLGLLLLQKDEPMPPLVTVAVPVPEREPRAAGTTPTVHFAFDLGRLAGEALRPGEYLVYLLSGPYLNGPHPLKVTR